MAKLLFDMTDEQLAIVADDTYLFNEKSKDNNLQREMYSGQKSAI